MDNIQKDIEELIFNIFNLFDKEIYSSDYEIKVLNPPHIPNQLPKKKMGIYLFSYNGNFLKIGKTGDKSQARFTSQHYLPKSAKSNLAKSILNDSSFIKDKNIDENNVGNWIKQNCQRIEIILNEQLGKLALSLIEVALHYKYHPKYEG